MCIVLCGWVVLVDCCVAADKLNALLINKLLLFKQTKDRIIRWQLAAASDFKDYFSCGYAFPWLFRACLHILWIRWIRVDELYNNTYNNAMMEEPYGWPTWHHTSETSESTDMTCLQRMLNQITARKIRVYELSLVKKEAFHGAKNLKMVSTKKDRCFFFLFTIVQKYLQTIHHHH